MNKETPYPIFQIDLISAVLLRCIISLKKMDTRHTIGAMEKLQRQ